ncbi:MAG: DNA polymerase III subunit beta [Clostridiales Family XIII bacterium]|jgi:DNA polymerase-3 subunit beta|nr:DNA polymerase III subunit beta [Clostridiales Family XIII bacterium]
MKFICDQENLVKALNIVSKAVSMRTTLPILKGILIKCDVSKKRVFLSASDLDISIETGTEALIEDEGSIVVSAKMFTDIVRKLPPGEVVFELKEGDIVEVKRGYSEFTLQGIPSDEFPRIESIEDGNSFSLEKTLLKNLIKGSCFAASTEEARGIITGVLLEMEKDSVSMVALDGYRMAIVKEVIKGDEERRLIISGRIVQEIGKLLADNDNSEEEDVEIKVSDKKAIFHLKDTKIVARLMEGEFIKYKDILPKDNNTKIKIRRIALMESVERASIIVREGKNSFIRFSLEEGQVIISSRAEEGTVRETVPIEIEGNPIEIGFNARYMIDTLKAIEDEEILMDFNTSISPCLVRPIEGEYYEYLILPVRLSTASI